MLYGHWSENIFLCFLLMKQPLSNNRQILNFRQVVFEKKIFLEDSLINLHWSIDIEKALEIV